MRISALYDALGQLVATPVVQPNRAIAVGMALGPQVGLDIVDTLLDEPALKRYHLLSSVRGDLLSSVRGDLLCKLERTCEAAAEFGRAASLAHNARNRASLLQRAVACRNGSSLSSACDGGG